MNCKLISLDTSTSSTGVAIYIVGIFSHHFLIETESKNAEDRFEEMVTKLYELIDKEKPDIVTTELTVVTRNAHSQRSLTMLLGAVYGKCIKEGIFYYSFRPSEWRSLIKTDQKPAGRKREDYKNWSLNVVKLLYGLDVEKDDISDAILIGRAYVNKFS